MYHSDPNAYARESAAQSTPQFREVYIAGRTPQQQASHDRAKGQALDALVTILTWMWIIGPITFAAKAGFNWHALTGDKGAAAERGAQALFRWKWFQFATFAGFVGVAATWDHLPPVLKLFNLIGVWCLFFWLVIYVRLAEFSLFRRGPVQWAMTPISQLLDGVHTWAIVVAALLPIPLGILAA